MVSPINDATTKVIYQLINIGYQDTWKIRALHGHTIKIIIINDHKPVSDTDKNILLVQLRSKALKFWNLNCT